MPPAVEVVYAGVSELVVTDSIARFAIVVRNVSDLVSFFECQLALAPSHDKSTAVPDLVLQKLIEYRNSYNKKFAAVALPRSLADQCPSLCLRLWKELDSVPYVIAKEPHQRTRADQGELATFAGWEEKQIDEQADSLARKCIRSFGIGHVMPAAQLDLHGMVTNFRVSFVDETDYQRTVGNRTWSLVQNYADDLRKRKVKVAFFSSTTHGRPDVSTRHALIRLAQCLGVDFQWYVPRPRPQLLDIIRRVQRILHCVEAPSQPLSADEELGILEWVYKTAKRYWLTKGGPLLPASDGGADVVVISDAILSSLALIAKQSDPWRPVVFENRLHVHHWAEDRDNDDNRRRWENQTLEFLRARLKHVDLLVSQEPKAFAPSLLPMKQVGYIPVAIDQIDGVNKPLQDWDISFYGRELNAICRSAGKPVLDYPYRRYFIHLVQLLPDEGTTRLLDSYKAFYHQYRAENPNASVPYFLICHYSSTNTPDTDQVHANLLTHIQSHMPDLEGLISIIRLRPPEQLWNSLVSQALAVVQLRDYEGIPEMLLGAVQKRTPVIVSREFAYYPFLQESNGALVFEYNEGNSLSQYLLDVVKGETQTEKHAAAKTRLEDRATTVGNALCWFFLTSELSRGEKVEPAGEDIYVMAERKDL
ncbi:uncharacterized protein TRUGW13939_10499 [Talaromyces rugulosus]|uniref:Glycosyl transferase family 1 domain-containing protein n=1 Tax=Talaromyces rugulosus TaxID=121627 RepID=A0A7H8RA63_TALRU|nr:uncharacterized protein TRUGW13939_10499 [Talaromyces rugulosus]QKX63329.1 hypothetical protein TRUGW13939_10499 [Talaromyces rugulosus]